jgi:hypothetical protein
VGTFGGSYSLLLPELVTLALRQVINSMSARLQSAPLVRKREAAGDVLEAFESRG